MVRIVTAALTALLLFGCSSGDWRDASREPAGIAPDPEIEKQAVIEAYAADAFGWRGWFAVHTWLAVKPENASEYTVYEVVGWGVEHGRPALRVYQTAAPDRYWYGAEPEKILSVSGTQAAGMISRIEEAASRYPWADQYEVLPGPNSNTFPAWIAIQVPELGLKLPFSAIGSGYADNDQ